jgi:hypothetical protein
MATSTNSHDKGGAESLLPGVVLSEVVARQLIRPPSQIPHTPEPTGRALNRIVN